MPPLLLWTFFRLKGELWATRLPHTDPLSFLAQRHCPGLTHRLLQSSHWWFRGLPERTGMMMGERSTSHTDHTGGLRYIQCQGLTVTRGAVEEGAVRKDWPRPGVIADWQVKGWRLLLVSSLMLGQPCQVENVNVIALILMINCLYNNGMTPVILSYIQVRCTLLDST